MSVINKKPFIKEVLESLSENESAALLSLIDGGAGATLSRTPSTITEDDAGVHRCYLSVKEGLFTGYLLLTDDYCVHIAYKDAQALDVIEIKDGKYEFITEPLDIAELRSELSDLGTVESAEILDVIEGAQSGSIVNVLGLDSGGALVKGTISGGTKLYLHHVDFGTVQFDVVCPVSSSFTSSTAKSYYVGVCSNNKLAYMTYTSPYGFVVWDSAGERIEAVEFIMDTVTEL